MSTGDQQATEQADEWQFGEWSGDASPAGGGLLREILEAVRKLQTDVAALQAELHATKQEVSETTTQLVAQVAGLRDTDDEDAITRLSDELAELRRILIGD